MHELIQRRGFEKRTYKIDYDSEFIEVDYKSLKERLRYKIQFTEIGNEIEYEADNVALGKIAIAFCGLVSLFCVGFYFLGNPEKPGAYIFNAFMWGGLSVLGLLRSNKDDILIVKGIRTIRFFRNKPSEEKVLEFANHLIKIANDKKKQFLINFETDEEHFMSNIQWLLNAKLIDRAEFEELKVEYKLKRLF